MYNESRPPAAYYQWNQMEWWSEKQEKFLTLARLAQQYPAILASTSAPFERFFSVSTQVLISKLKGRMHPETASTLILLNANKEELL